MKKITLAILFGGASSEHEISCIRAKGILSNINKEKYDIKVKRVGMNIDDIMNRFII